MGWIRVFHDELELKRRKNTDSTVTKKVPGVALSKYDYTDNLLTYKRIYDY